MTPKDELLVTPTVLNVATDPIVAVQVIKIVKKRRGFPLSFLPARRLEVSEYFALTFKDDKVMHMERATRRSNVSGTYLCLKDGGMIRVHGPIYQVREENLAGFYAQAKALLTEKGLLKAEAAP